MEHKSWAGNASGYRAHGGAMNGGSATRCYDVLGRQTVNGWHGKAENLTTMRMEGSAVSGEYPRRRVTIGGGDWNEREGAGEVKSGQNETTTRNR